MTGRNQSSFVAAIGVGLIVAASAIAHEPTTFAWKFAQGDRFVTDWKQGFESRVTIQDAQGQTLRRIETTYDLSMRIGWSVVEAGREQGVESQGEHKIVTEQTIESLSLSVRAPGNVLRKLELPSESEPPTEFAALHAALKEALGAPIRVTLSPRGEPLSVELPPAWAKLGEDEGLGPAARQLATAEGWKGLLASSATPLPEGPVAVGASWSGEEPTLGELPYRTKTTWTLESVEADVATIRLSANLEKIDDAGVGQGTAPDSAEPVADDPTAGVAITGFERTGTATFDVAGGTLTKLATTTKLNLGKRSGDYVLATQQSGSVTVETKRFEGNE